ncbi:hypothetical protein LQZ19_17390 [Treponema primitia]|uniref:hypothetical protein n=1 Tax=Treponema primitia TaxID=88058 RepID=UPI00398124A8
MNTDELNTDKLADAVADAVAAGRFHDAPQEEALLVRLSALENIVKLYKEIVARQGPGVA